MSIGNKIKNLRKKMGFTQKELADGIISRSMLSLIESDLAMPSMQSLCALSEKLSVSPSFLLEDGNDISSIELMHLISVIENEIQIKNYENALGIIEHSNIASNKRISDIYIKCAFEVALTSFYNGNFKNASSILKRISGALDDSFLTNTEVVSSRISFLNNVMDNIEDIEYAIENAYDRFDFEFEPSLFFSLFKLLKQGRHDVCNNLLEFCTLNERYTNFIKAQMLIKDYKFIDAVIQMKSISLTSDCPLFLKLLAFKTTENCCKMCEDFKGAYENHLAYQEALANIIK